MNHDTDERTLFQGRQAIFVLLALPAAGCLYALSHTNYLLYHSLIELIAVGVAVSVFSIGWNTRHIVPSNILFLLAAAYGCIAAMDLLHTLAYTGMGVFPEQGANLPTQLWIATRSLEALSLLAAGLLLGSKHRLPTGGLLVGYGLLTGVLLSAIFLGFFPAMYVQGHGLTLGKVGGEYLICAILATAAWLFWRQRWSFPNNSFSFFLAAIGATIASELSFTLYTDVYGFFNFLGHLLKLISVLFIYRALVSDLLLRPYEGLFRDLAQSRDALQQKEVQLRAAKEKLRGILNTAPSGIILVNLEGRITFANERMAEMLGYEVTELKGSAYLDYTSEPQSHEAQKQMFRLMHGEIRYVDTERLYQRKDGTQFWGSLVGTRLSHEDGTSPELVGIITDISDRKQAEERLQNAHDKLDKLVQLNVDGLMVLDPEGGIRFLNPAATRMLGREKEELVGEQFGYPLFPAASAEIELLSGSGEANVVELRTTETEWDGQNSLLTSLRDITDRKQAEEEVNHLNRVLRSVRYVNQLITVEKDRNRLIQGVCDKLVEARGYDNAWIALLSESGEFTAFAEAGLERVLDMLAEKCLQSELPYCGRKALEQSDLVLVQDPGAICTGCPLSGDYESRTGIAVPLKHKSEVYGVLSLSLPAHFGFREEQDLVREVGDDIGYALYSIDLEEKRRQHESEQEIILNLLHKLHQFPSVPELISEVTSMLKAWSECEAIGIRLQQGDDYPYYVTRGFPEEHIRLENNLCEVDAHGEVLRDFQGNPVLECMCGNVLKGHFDSSLPFFTEKGSFWTNSTTDLLNSSTEDDRQARTRNRCQGEGYESVALIPLRHGEQTLGLLQFNDPRRDRFTKHCIHLLERIADNLALGLVQRQTKDGLREREQLFRQLFEQAPIGIIIATADHTIVETNQTALSIVGFSREEILHLSAWDIIYTGEFSSDSPESTLQGMFSDNPADWEKNIRTKQGDSIHALVNMANLPYYSEKASHMIMFQDISERKQAEERIYNLAYYDEITGLPNRRLFHDRLKQVAAQSENFGDGGIVFLVDITRLREVNDTLGLQAGDELIQEVGRRLRDAVLKEDTVARISGGEFMLLSEGLGTEDRARNLGVHILEGIGQKLELSGRLIYPEVKIGFTLFPQRGTDPDTLVKQANMALSEAKKSAHSIQEFAWQEDWISKQFHLEHDLKQALGNEEFFLCYQSQIDLRSGRIVGLEALLRWKHPQRGVVSPGEFIPVLEHTGMIPSAGEWVIHRVCKQLKTWQDSGIFVKTSVNLSAQELSNDATLDIVRAALEENGVRAENLEVEITETSLMENVDRASWVLQTLSSRGVKVALDDFGKGYSSLSYLQKLAINIIKIDKQFVDGLPENQDSITLVHTIISMAHNMGKEVLAEGVEREEQRQKLCELGCDYGQGFLWSRPQPVENLSLK